MKSVKMIFLGAPGSGKGTIAELLVKNFNITHISTGDIFREKIKNKTPLGVKAKKYIDSGQLVPDELVCNMVAKRLTEDDCESGFLLDGFPRTIKQAEVFDKVVKEKGLFINLVAFFDVKENILIERLTARLTCKQCGTNFNKLFSPPKETGVCDKCQGELYQRSDDSLETALNRMKIYNEQTAPLVDYYKKQEKLATIPAEGPVQENYDKLIEVLKDE